MWPNPQETADLVTFIEEIFNGKLHLLCNVKCTWTLVNLLISNVRKTWSIVLHVKLIRLLNQTKCKSLENWFGEGSYRDVISKIHPKSTQCFENLILEVGATYYLLKIYLERGKNRLNWTRSENFDTCFE